MDQKVKHLEFVQRIINRMTNDSIMTKGWCITLVSALFVLADNETNTKFAMIEYIPVITFWILDSYFLYQERLFRSLYDEIRLKEETDFSMDTRKYEGGRNTWMATIFSQTICIFYISLAIIILTVQFVLM